MKTRCTILASALAASLQLAAIAAVPVAWTNSPGMPPYPTKPVPHGVPIDFRVTLRGYTVPPIADGADVRLWYQTNGMGSAWWSAPATFDGSTITATFGPAQDCGADRVSLFFGAPSNVFASAVLRLTHAPGFVPNSLPLPAPVLDFGAVELRGLAALTNGWSFAEADPLFVAWLPGFAVATNDAVQAAIRAVDELADELDRGDRIVHDAYYAGYALNADNAYLLYLGNRLVGADDLIAESTNAAVAVADAKISTNNPAFVTAVLTSPLVGADPSDLSELAEYGSYGTVGAAILALIAGLAALKRRVGAAETAIDGKADAANLPYALVVPGEWQFSGSEKQDGHVYSLDFSDEGEGLVGCDLMDGSTSLSYTQFLNESQIGNVIDFAAVGNPGIDIVATRTQPGHLTDRAVNAVAVTGATTLTLPASNAGHARDLYVRLTVSATSAVTWTVAQGETWDAMGAPPSSFAAGTYLYGFREVAPGVWHCEDMLALVGLEAALAAINGGVAP